MDDFEKLTIAKLHIKKLKFEIGVLQSEKAELEDIIKADASKSRLRKLRDQNKALKKSYNEVIAKLNSKK